MSSRTWSFHMKYFGNGWRLLLKRVPSRNSASKTETGKDFGEDHWGVKVELTNGWQFDAADDSPKRTTRPPISGEIDASWSALSRDHIVGILFPRLLRAGFWFNASTVIRITFRPRPTKALNVTFPIPPHAGQGSTILWKREDNDPKEVWLRKRYLSGAPGVAPWVADNVHLNLTLPGGVDSISFARSGFQFAVFVLVPRVYNVGIFDKPDNPPSSGQFTLQPIGIVEVSVSEAVNSTSSAPGAIQTVSNTVDRSKIRTVSSIATTTGTTGQLPPGQNDSKRHILSNGAIAGIVVGVLMLVLILTMALCIRSRRAKAERDEADYHQRCPIPFVQILPSREAGVIKGAGLSGQSPGIHNSTEGDSPITPRVVRHGPIEHEDSGWRPPVPEDETIELPPTYRDSTRKVGGVRIGRRSGLYTEGITESGSSPIGLSPTGKLNPEKQYYSRQ
ncbi:hypothetical protein L218DRAFT_948960 [Marasmius fiardii PR-910]|nr:hypothetical protein L218DRAFT_948960 [Marasmius fiardii PR-910]